MSHRSVGARLIALVCGSLQGVRRARGSGLSFAAMLVLVLRAMRQGPRAFVRKVMRYGSAADGGHGSRPTGRDYGLWLDSQPVTTRPAVSGGAVSVVMPVCNTPQRYLREVVDSVLAQNYPDWELCIHDDASDAPWMRPMLEDLERGDHRVRVSYGTRRAGIASATNAALKLAQGRWVAFVDHDDVLHPNALADCVAGLQASGAQIIYTDHDLLDDTGTRRSPYFKPDWNLDLFLSQMYLGHLVLMERSLVAKVGGLRSEMDGAQDYDLVLRCVAEGAAIAHVPKVLYQWRQHQGSTSSNAASKPYAHHAGRRAVQEFVDRRYPGARVEDSEYLFCYDVRYPLTRRRSPQASIVIPTRDRVDLLEVCMSTLRGRTTAVDYEVIIVDNGSKEPTTHAWFREVQQSDPRVRVLPADVPFNWSALNNMAASQAKGDVLVFLNNDTEVTQSDWLERLVEVAQRPDVGVCGPLLLYPDGTIQHAGVVVGMGGWADHVYKGLAPVHDQHLFTSPMLRRNVLAVTGACMVIEAKKFQAIGGFDESFIVCGSDVELCLRAHAAGLRNVYVPEARLIHHESKTRDPRAIPDEDFTRSAEAYHPFRTEGDPYYNPNLDPMSPIPELRSPQ